MKKTTRESVDLRESACFRDPNGSWELGDLLGSWTEVSTLLLL